MDNRLLVFKKTISNYSNSHSEQEWNAFQSHLKPISYKKGDDIFPTSKICTEIIFITEGIIAIGDQGEDDYIITRFCKPKELCGNLESSVTNSPSNSRIFAITNVEAVLIPYDVVLKVYLYSNSIGLYFRKRLLECIIEDRQIMSAKTLSGVEPKLNFLQEYYPEVILNSPWKYIANFMGVTPEWLSRTLKKKNNHK